jgi:YggT family protein
MSAVFSVLWLLLWVFFVLLLVRMVFDLVQSFARAWEPRGPLLVGLEAVYTVTDPPLRTLRRLIPPLRLGSVGIDLGFLVLVIAIQILLAVLRQAAAAA